MSYTDLPPPNMSSLDDLSSYDPMLWDDAPEAPAETADLCLPGDGTTPSEEPPAEEAPDDTGGTVTAGLPAPQKYPLPEVVVPQRSSSPVPTPAKETGDAVLDDLLYAGLDLDPDAAATAPEPEPEMARPSDELLVPQEWDTPPLLATLGSGLEVTDDELLALPAGNPGVAAQVQHIVDDNKKVLAALDPDVFQIYLPGTGNTDEQRERQLAALDRKAGHGSNDFGFLP